MGDILVFNNLLFDLYEVLNQSLRWGKFFKKEIKKDFHLNYNLEIFFCASSLACRTLYKDSLSHKELFLGDTKLPMPKHTF